MAGIGPLCFVLMPCGKKPDPRRAGKEIDFDRLYDAAIRPGIADAGMRPIRADEEDRTSGIIHKPTFEQLVLCDHAVIELTAPNPNVSYELGIRHALRPDTSVPIFADHTQPAFDVAHLGALPYALGPDSRLTDELAAKLRATLSARLRADREVASAAGIRATDGALFELLDRYGGHDKTDVFRDRVAYDPKRRQQLAEARAMKSADAVERLKEIQKELQPLAETEAGVIIDLYLSYRAVSAWAEMLALVEAMPLVLQRSVLVREQRAFALNRLAGQAPNARHLRQQAIALLDEVLAETGPNAETCGLLGRIHKDRWQEAAAAGQDVEAAARLRDSITAYVRGFEADCRDAYPGVNAVTLLDVEGTDDGLKKKRELLPVVRFAVERRLAGGAPDYWDRATLVELSVLEDRPQEATERLDAALDAVREGWEPETTAKNLIFIRDARAARGLDVAWIDRLVSDLRAPRVR
jgi:uncharacterized protein DUF4071